MNKKLHIVSFFLLLAVCVIGQEQTLVILHTNDLHSKLTGFAPESEYSPLVINNDKTLGGFARISSIIKTEREKNPGNVLVVDAGDFSMGSFFHVLEPETGFQLQLMESMGYDAVAIGNHEFDNGPESLSQTINSALKSGSIPQLCIANIIFSNKDDRDNNLAKLYDDGVIAPYTIVKKSGLKIGIFSIVGVDAINVTLNGDPLKFAKPIKTAKRTSKYLKQKEEVDFVICLSHSGVVPGKNGNWEGEDFKMAKKCKYIDVIISGHSHTLLNEVLWSNDIPIVQTGAFGIYVGRLELSIKDGEIARAQYKLIQVNDEILGDEEIHERIMHQKLKLNELFLDNLDISYDQPVVEASFEMLCDEYSPEESNIGPLITDAIYHYVNNNTKEGTDFTFIATGLIRDRIRIGSTGMQTASDIFRIVSLGEGKDNVPGYPIARIYLTAKEIKSVIELLMILAPSNLSSYCYYSGIKVYINPDKGFMKKIRKIEIDGESIDMSKENEKLYSISTDVYMIKSIGLIKEMSYGLIKVVPKYKDGRVIKDFDNAVIDINLEKPGIQEGKEWLALLEYFKTFEDLNGNNIPDIPDYYKDPHIVFHIVNY